MVKRASIDDASDFDQQIARLSRDRMQIFPYIKLFLSIKEENKKILKHKNANVICRNQ